MKQRNSLRLVRAVVIASVLGLAFASGAWAVPMTFSNATSIEISATGDSGQGSPYSSSILVSGLVDPISDVNVTLNDVSHSFPADIYIVLQGPDDTSLVLWNDAGGSLGISAIHVTFYDQAADPIPVFPSPDPMAEGAYQVSNYGTIPGPADTDPAPNPISAPNLFVDSLADFNGLDPNGEWRLWTYDDAGGDLGRIAGGWSITIDTQPIPEPSAALLFGVGSLVVGGSLRRRRA